MTDLCYCKQVVPAGGRRVEIDVTVDWGATDLRGMAGAKHYVFCSFDCASQWATDRAAAHDGVVVTEGVEGSNDA